MQQATYAVYGCAHWLVGAQAQAGQTSMITGLQRVDQNERRHVVHEHGHHADWLKQVSASANATTK